MRGPAKLAVALLLGSLVVVVAHREGNRTEPATIAANPPAATASSPAGEHAAGVNAAERPATRESAAAGNRAAAQGSAGKRVAVQGSAGKRAAVQGPAGKRAANQELGDAQAATGEPAGTRAAGPPAGKATAGKRGAAAWKPVAARQAKKPGRPRTVALTFDDGPSPYTAQILKILRRHHVKATFCQLGGNVRDYRKVARKIVREGHRICNHSRDHADFTTLSRTQARANVRQSQAKIRSVTGRGPRTFRFPYGASNSATRAVVRAEGLRILGWTVDTLDWQKPPASTITRRVVRNVHPGAIVLMHDGGGDRSHTVASLDATIRKLKAKGYTFVRA